MGVTIFCRLLVILYFFQCHYSQNVVPSCPQNKELWEAKNKRFGCYIDQKYHCLKNTQDELVELCFGVISLQNKEGCPILLSSNGFNGITSRECQDTAYFIGCPGNSTGMYLSYETYKYPSCIKVKEKSEWTSEPTEVKTTASKSSIYTAPLIKNDCAKKKKMSLSYSQRKDNSGVKLIFIAVVVAVALVSVVGITGDFVFMRRGLKLEEITTEDV